MGQNRMTFNREIYGILLQDGSTPFVQLHRQQIVCVFDHCGECGWFGNFLMNGVPPQEFWSTHKILDYRFSIVRSKGVDQTPLTPTYYQR